MPDRKKFPENFSTRPRFHREREAGKNVAGLVTFDFHAPQPEPLIMPKTPAWQRKEGKSPDGGLNAAGRASYNRANPGKPGLKPPAPHPKTEKDAARRKSFCARMGGMPGPMKDDQGRPTRKAKSLKAWNC